MSKIVNLAERTSGARWSAEQALERALEMVRSGELAPSKVVVLCLDDRDGNYRVDSVQAGLDYPGMVALLAVAQQQFVTRLVGE